MNNYLREVIDAKLSTTAGVVIFEIGWRVSSKLFAAARHLHVWISMRTLQQPPRRQNKSDRRVASMQIYRAAGRHWGLIRTPRGRTHSLQLLHRGILRGMRDLCSNVVQMLDER
eukprot:3346496-Amphidinium_carterae.2